MADDSDATDILFEFHDHELLNESPSDLSSMDMPLIDWHPHNGNSKDTSSTIADLNLEKLKSQILKPRAIPAIKKSHRDEGLYDIIHHSLVEKTAEKFGHKAGREPKFKLTLDLSHFKIKDLNDPSVALISALLDEQLIKEGLFKDEADEMTLTEAFPREQSNEGDRLALVRLDKINFKGQQYNYDDPLDDSNEEWEDAHTTNSGGPFLSMYPLLAQPMVHTLMRRAPWNMQEKIARLMVENHFFEKHPEHTDLLPAACFFSKGILTKEIFEPIRENTYVNGRFHLRGKEFTYAEYLEDIEKLKEIIKIQAAAQTQTPWVKASAVKYVKTLESGTATPVLEELLKSFWERFDGIWQSLTAKQTHALQIIYTEPKTLSYTEAAKRLRISRDSFQDRVKGAVQKFKAALPELKFLVHALTSEDIKKSNYLYSDLYDKREAARIHPLFREIQSIGLKVRIAPRWTSAKMLDLTDRQKREILCDTLTRMRVPDYHFTDFFCGLFPDNYLERLQGESLYEGHGLHYVKMMIKLRTDVIL